MNQEGEARTVWSRAELLEIAALGRDPEGLVLARDLVRSALQSWMDRPDMDWETFVGENDGVISTVQVKGRVGVVDLLHEAYNRWDESRQVADYWRKQYERNPEEVLAEVQQVLGFEAGEMTADQLRFAPDCCAVYLSEQQAQRVDDRSKTTTESRPVGKGFISRELFLVDDVGRKCGIAVINQDEGDVITERHERFHLLMYHFRREKLMRLQHKEGEEIALLSERWVRWLKEGRVDVDDILQAWGRYWDKHLVVAQEAFVDELVATLSSARERSYGRDTFDRVLAYFAHDGEYGHWLQDRFGKVRREIFQSEMDGERLMGLQVALMLQRMIFLGRIVLAADWVQRVWEQSNQDELTTISALLVVPPNRLWSVGIFLGQDHQDLRRHWRQLPEDVRQRIGWIETEQLLTRGPLAEVFSSLGRDHAMDYFSDVWPMRQKAFALLDACKNGVQPWNQVRNRIGKMIRRAFKKVYLPSRAATMIRGLDVLEPVLRVMPRGEISREDIVRAMEKLIFNGRLLSHGFVGQWAKDNEAGIVQEWITQALNYEKQILYAGTSRSQPLWELVTEQDKSLLDRYFTA